MYGRKYMGVFRKTFLIGPDGRIARIWPKVRVPGHAEEVLAAARNAVIPAIAGGFQRYRIAITGFLTISD